MIEVEADSTTEVPQKEEKEDNVAQKQSLSMSAQLLSLAPKPSDAEKPSNPPAITKKEAINTCLTGSSLAKMEGTTTPAKPKASTQARRAMFGRRETAVSLRPQDLEPLPMPNLRAKADDLSSPKGGLASLRGRTTLTRMENNKSLKLLAGTFRPKDTTDAVIVIDNGSSFIKGGFAGKQIPSSVVHSVCKYTDDDRYFVGASAYDVPKGRLVYPLEPLHEHDWNALEDSWEYIYERELFVKPDRNPVIMTEVPMMCSMARNKMAEILFEMFEVPALHIGNSAVMSLFSQGMTTGLVVECGNRFQVIPVVNGTIIETSSRKSRVGLAGLTEYFSRLLARRGYPSFCQSPKELDIARKIKESACYTVMDYEAEIAKPEVTAPVNISVMRNGAKENITLELGNERFMVPEAIFRPSELLGIDMVGIQHQIFDVVKHCPIDVRKTLLQNIVLSGGSTLFPGFAERLQKEVLDIARTQGFGLRNSDVVVKAPRNRKFLSWAGGSLLGSMIPDFVENQCLSIDDYLDCGYYCKD